MTGGESVGTGRGESEIQTGMRQMERNGVDSRDRLKVLCTSRPCEVLDLG